MKIKEISCFKYLSINILKFACVFSEVKVILMNMYLSNLFKRIWYEQYYRWKIKVRATPIFRKFRFSQWKKKLKLRRAGL